MKTAESNAVGDGLLDQVLESVSRPVIKTEWYSDTQSTWKEFDPGDIEGRSITLDNSNDRYQVHSFMPPSKKLNLTLNNFDQAYSTGSQSGKGDIVKRNLLIRCWTGFELTFGASSSISDDFITRTKFVHTKLLSGEVVPDITSYTGTVATVSSLGTFYSGGSYSTSGSYAYPGYYTKRFHMPIFQQEDARTLAITTTSNKFHMKYRSAPQSNMIGATDWSGYTTISTGANSFSLDAPKNNSYFEYIVRFNNTFWSTADRITAASLSYVTFDYLYKQGVFLTDEPKLSDKVTISGRDYLKKALETEINMPWMTASDTVTNYIAKVLDRCNIPYDTSNWDLTATTVSMTAGQQRSNFNNVSGWKVIDKLMDALNAGNDDWKFRFTEDGQAQVKIIPTATEADVLTHYHFNIEGRTTKDYDSDRQLQRVTARNASISWDAETTLATASGTCNSTLTITYATAGNVRYEATNGNGWLLSETDRDYTSVSLSCATGNTYSISVYGTKPQSLPAGVIWAERGNADNILKKNGNTLDNQNEFFNQTAAEEYCDYVIGRFGDPSFRAIVKQVPNPLVELDDNFLLFDRDTVTDTIFGLRKIQEDFRDPSLKVTYTLIDKGIDFTNFVWDRHGGKHTVLSHYTGVNDLNWDTNLVWGYDFGPTATEDPADYSDTKKRIAS